MCDHAVVRGVRADIRALVELLVDFDHTVSMALAQLVDEPLQPLHSLIHIWAPIVLGYTITPRDPSGRTMHVPE